MSGRARRLYYLRIDYDIIKGFIKNYKYVFIKKTIVNVIIDDTKLDNKNQQFHLGRELSRHESRKTLSFIEIGAIVKFYTL
jgi:hypothetical protein